MIYYIYINNLNYFHLNTLIIYLCLDLIIANTLLIYFMKNPIYSLILLILNYLLTGFLFIYNGLVFLGLIIILIYCGAISILLIFTFMLLNLRTMYYRSLNIKHFYTIYFLLFLMQNIFFALIKKNNDIFYFDSYIYVDWYNMVFLKADFTNLGYEIFINNTDLISLFALLLTFVLIGSTSLVNFFKDSKKQENYKQLKKYSTNVEEN